MARPRGGYIGFNRVPAASSPNSAAIGVWTQREAESLKRAGTWPILPPAGVGAGLQLWLDAADSSTLYDATTGGSLVAANGGVARWEDKSGNERHATQGAAANQPVLTANGRNGRNVLTFDGTDDFMVHSFNLPSPATTFAVAELTSVGTSGYELLFGANGANQPIGSAITARVLSSNNWGSYIDEWKGSSYSIQGSCKVMTQIAKTTSPDVFRTNGNGQNISWSSRITFVDGNSRQYIGGERPPLPGGNMKGKICEIIAYTSVLSDESISLVESYLMEKWGIT